MMALPSCRLSSAINYTLLSQQERCSLSPDVRTQTNARARAPRTQRDRHLQSVCHLFCWHLRPHGIVGETAICCRQGWIRRGQGGEVHHAALFCWSELCEVLCRDGTWRLLFESEIIQQQKNVLFKLLSFLLLLLNRLQFPLQMLQI